MSELAGQNTRDDLAPEITDLAECVALLNALERKIGEMEFRYDAAGRTARYLRSRFRDLLDVLESPPMDELGGSPTKLTPPESATQTLSPLHGKEQR